MYILFCAALPCVCMYVYACVCVCVCMFTYIPIFIYLSFSVFISVCTYVTSFFCKYSMYGKYIYLCMYHVYSLMHLCILDLWSLPVCMVNVSIYACISMFTPVCIYVSSTFGLFQQHYSTSTPIISLRCISLHNAIVLMRHDLQLGNWGRTVDSTDLKVGRK